MKASREEEEKGLKKKKKGQHLCGTPASTVWKEDKDESKETEESIRKLQRELGEPRVTEIKEEGAKFSKKNSCLKPGKQL